MDNNVENVNSLFLKLKKGIALSEDEKRIAFPCLFPILVPIEKVRFNDYNPNNVASDEMKLLRHSILEDGYTQPVVGIYNENNDIYYIVDGAHRYKNAVDYFKLPCIPIVVINKEIKDRIASTIRHNRARGEHAVLLMSNIVADLFKMGWSDNDICTHLGMSNDEVLRLKQNTGLPDIFKDEDYSTSWQ